MANPSLQIGNGKFAIKENELLGYSSSGTRFFPIPITMTRATLGSRVNSSGLIEDVALLGDELVTNGDFATDTDWDKLNGSTISGGVGNVVANGAISSTATNWGLYQSNVFSPSKSYRIKFRARQTNGSGNFNVGYSWGYILDEVITSSFVDYTIYFTTSSNGWENALTFGGLTIGDTFEVDNVSVKEATIDGLARVDYTDGTASLLAEPQRTNLITYSEDFSQSFWTKQEILITSNATSSPSGDVNASKIIPTSVSSTHQLSKTSLISSQICTMSLYAKEEGLSTFHFLDGDNGFHGSIFNLSDGTFTNQGTGLGSIENMGNGWYRCIVTVETTGYRLYIPNSSSTYTGNDVDGIYIFGAQLEAGSYPTSYIKTQGSSVTRNQDEYTKTGISDKINSEEGVLFLEMSALADDGTSRCISIFQNGSNFIKFIYSATSNRVDYVAFSGGNVSCNITNVISNTTINTKFALKWKVNDFALWINGTEVGTDSSGDTPLGMDKMNFTDEGGSGNKFFGKIKQLQVFKTALSDSELATLTTL
jgi:hypothetical protein